MPRKITPASARRRTQTFIVINTPSGAKPVVKAPTVDATGNDRLKLGAQLQRTDLHANRPRDSYYEHRILNAIKLQCKDLDVRLTAFGIVKNEKLTYIEKNIQKYLPHQWGTLVENGKDLIPILTQHQTNLESNRFLKDKSEFMKHHFGIDGFDNRENELEIFEAVFKVLFIAYRRANQLARALREINKRIPISAPYDQVRLEQVRFTENVVKCKQYWLDHWDASILAQYTDIDPSDLYPEHQNYKEHFQLNQVAGCIARGGYLEVTPDQFRAFLRLYKMLADTQHTDRVYDGHVMAEACFDIISRKIGLDLFFEIAATSIDQNKSYYCRFAGC